ncbi:hypothetical protein BUALT_Bualt07G0148100 [Buddleja alternifolia]|uniref:Uncharacterized protein n=1 Tax=Buddleja alternifolia TaxID=168488 RepID=A0AAV6XF69_9LAMI|nr:hypothetical protein BUALT_Bualt07G0148100 [Buddleja alternifolia]
MTIVLSHLREQIGSSIPNNMHILHLILMQEIAEDIVQKKESDEASNIINEGQKAVAGIKEAAELVASDINPPHKTEGECSKEVIKAQVMNNVETYCQCSSNMAVIMESSIDECRVKEPFSAPF